MIRVTFPYHNVEGSRFDMEYYLSNHLKLSADVFGSARRGLTVDRGLSGIEPGSPPPFHAAAHMLFDSVEDFYAALMPRIEELKADVPKYTDVETVIHIGDVLSEI